MPDTSLEAPKIVTPQEAELQERMRRADAEIAAVCKKYHVLLDAYLIYGDHRIQPGIRMIPDPTV